MSINTQKTHKYLVGKPELPTLEIYQKKVTNIWRSQNFTNFGYYASEFENSLSKYYQNEVVIFSNGTSALEALIGSLCVDGEVLTSPYSFVATLTAIRRNKLRPNFSDVSLGDGNLDPTILSEAITRSTKLLVGVHCYGFAVKVKEMDQISKRYELPLIYDAAHTFGATYEGEHLANFGLASILSFHATKILSAVEGGAVVTQDKSLANELRKFRNFGRHPDTSMHGFIGTNSKMSELHAAYGLTQLKNFELILNKRRELFYDYVERLRANENCILLEPIAGCEINGSYFPFRIRGNKCVRDRLIKFLAKHKISAKAYFDINLATIYGIERQYSFVNTEKLTNSVICLPIHSEMERKDVNYITSKINDFFSK